MLTAASRHLVVDANRGAGLRPAMPPFMAAFFCASRKCPQESGHSRPEARSTVGGGAERT